jgi:hypothetical protein
LSVSHECSLWRLSCNKASLANKANQGYPASANEPAAKGRLGAASWRSVTNVDSRKATIKVSRQAFIGITSTKLQEAWLVPFILRDEPAALLRMRIVM